MMIRISSVAICWSLVAALGPAEAVAANTVAAPLAAATPQPQTSQAPANAKLDGGNASPKAPHLLTAGRKSWHSFGYMKQANDDRDGLSRIEAQARQLSPPR